MTAPRLAVTPAELPQLGSQGPVPVRLDGLVTLGAARLPDQLGRPPLGDPEHPLQVLNGAPPAGRAHQFPRPSSFKASMWSFLSATIRFNRAFSLSSSLSSGVSGDSRLGLLAMGPRRIQDRGSAINVAPPPRSQDFCNRGMGTPAR